MKAAKGSIKSRDRRLMKRAAKLLTQLVAPGEADQKHREDAAVVVAEIEVLLGRGKSMVERKISALRTAILQKMLFPSMTASPMDAQDARQLVNKLADLAALQAREHSKFLALFSDYGAVCKSFEQAEVMWNKRREEFLALDRQLRELREEKHA